MVTAADINMIQRPCVVQQYYDHDAVLYKVIVDGVISDVVTVVTIAIVTT